MGTGNGQLEKRLWEGADQLRANSALKSSEYAVPVLGLIFLSFADNRCGTVREKLDDKQYDEKCERVYQHVYESYFTAVATLEEMAEDKGIPIREPFQGEYIGEFFVLAPTKSRYLELIVQSEKTPESVSEEKKTSVAEWLHRTATKAVRLVQAAWGDEAFSAEETSAENDMSVIQYACLLGDKTLLTGDAGRGGLWEAADFAPAVGLVLPGIDRFQVPHHGSRRNVSTKLLDHWLGNRLDGEVEKGKERFHAIVSASKKDEDHPRKAVLRAMYHRGARPITTEDSDKRTGKNAPDRAGWVSAKPVPYPHEQEQD
ncbi:MAG: type I restriction-modification system subunit M N-terminal domain-containing protein [Pirellulaceae bacterium]